MDDRTGLHAALDDVLGYFVNLVPLRCHSRIFDSPIFSANFALSHLMP